MERFKPSDSFFWGSSTSAHQVEGGNTSDWTEYETKSAKLKAQNAAKQNWPDFILKNYPDPLQEENYISGRACDHYNRFREDFDIAKSLGHNAHRFSIEWSRIEPEEGKFDEREIGHYREVIRALRERGIEPFVTLWHFTLPLWVVKKGGWASGHTVGHFVRYSERMAKEFQGEVKFWITLNEPSLWCGNAYLLGILPPQRKNLFDTARVYWNLHRAYCGVYDSFKKINGNFKIGVAESMEWYESRVLRIVSNYFRNFFFLHTTVDRLDFVGVNYYKSVGRSKNLSDMGWGINSGGLYVILKRTWSFFRKPIFITENGIADARDEKRGEFIREHIDSAHKAILDGVDLRGYFYWSLLDNFEWDKGFWPRFGLTEVDYTTLERRIRASALTYKEIIEKNAI